MDDTGGVYSLYPFLYGTNRVKCNQEAEEIGNPRDAHRIYGIHRSFFEGVSSMVMLCHPRRNGK